METSSLPVAMGGAEAAPGTSRSVDGHRPTEINALLGSDRNRKRDAEIRAMWAAGFTLSKIATRFKMTDARIWQIVNRPKPQPTGEPDA